MAGSKIQGIFEYLLIAGAILASWQGLTLYNSCQKGLENDEYIKNKSYLVGITVFSAIIALYFLLTLMDEKLATDFKTIVIAICTLAAAAISLNFKNKCEQGLENVDTTLLVIITIGSLLVSLGIIYFNHGHKIKKGINNYKASKAEAAAAAKAQAEAAAAAAKAQAEANMKAQAEAVAAAKEQVRANMKAQTEAVAAAKEQVKSSIKAQTAAKAQAATQAAAASQTTGLPNTIVSTQIKSI
jgi:F0F1-type ATP synthase membrane subunit b/b'